MGILHGSQPDLIVLCHDAKRIHMSSCPERLLPSVRECIDLHLQCAHIVNPDTRCTVTIAISKSVRNKSASKSYRRLARLGALASIM